ncbi:MAG: ester cyclase [Candidatus Thorarchaeota archaeon]|nr:MAG: ester cyclase [Candidatus Thorarchaeota archaeon]
MSKQRSESIGRRWFEEMWSKPDLNVADELIHPDYDPDWVSIDAKGPDQVKHEIRYFRSVFPDLEYEVVESIGEEDKVWIRYIARGTQKGNAWGFEPTNKIVEFEGATILYIDAEGKVVNRWGAFCFYDILVGLELAPPIWELSKRD